MQIRSRLNISGIWIICIKNEIAAVAVSYTHLARQENVKIQPPVRLSGTHYASAALERLEQSLFAPTGNREPEQTEDICLILCRDAYEEAEYTAAVIRALVRDRGYAYRDIAVLSRTPEMYTQKLYTAFSRLAIPFFTDQTRPASDHPLVRFIESALACAARGFTPERVLPLVKSGMCGISPEESLSLIHIYQLKRGFKAQNVLSVQRYRTIGRRLHPEKQLFGAKQPDCGKNKLS